MLNEVVWSRRQFHSFSCYVKYEVMLVCPLQFIVIYENNNIERLKESGSRLRRKTVRAKLFAILIK